MKTVTGTKSLLDTTHCDDLIRALETFRDSGPLIERWGTELARRLGAGARLLVAGNGGSAAQAQHLTAELVGRYRDDRPPFSAVALHADTSSTTAIANDYGVQEVFARQTAAHGRPGDVLLLLSTSGASANLLAAADRAHRLGMTVWALTGRPPNPLQLGADDALCVDAPVAATVQELHLVAVHMLCEAFDQAVQRGTAADRTDTGGTDGTPVADGKLTADGRPVEDGNSVTDGRPGVVGRLVGRARSVGRLASGTPGTPGTPRASGKPRASGTPGTPATPGGAGAPGASSGTTGAPRTSGAPGGSGTSGSSSGTSVPPGATGSSSGASGAPRKGHA